VFNRQISLVVSTGEIHRERVTCSRKLMLAQCLKSSDFSGATEERAPEFRSCND
jgi:hypothetical protein